MLLKSLGSSILAEWLTVSQEIVGNKSLKLFIQNLRQQQSQQSFQKWQKNSFFFSEQKGENVNSIT